MTSQERQQYFDRLVAALGTTEIWTASGYILPDGSLLDMSNEEIYPDPTVRVYTHPDLEKFFGFNSEEIMLLGGIRMGFGDMNDLPYMQIALTNYAPTEFQYRKIGELLNTEPYSIDLELNMNLHDLSTSFYKRYTASEHTIENIKADLNAYMNGDTTNYGHFNEKFGTVDEDGQEEQIISQEELEAQEEE